jgi:hypothetical protein
MEAVEFFGEKNSQDKPGTPRMKGFRKIKVKKTEVRASK